MTCDDKWPAHKAARFLIVAALATWVMALIVFGVPAWIVMKLLEMFS